MKAIILAAGLSSRLHPRTLHQPKCLLHVGGRAIMDHQLELLHGAGVDDVTIATGWQAAALTAHVGSRASFRHVAGFATANSLHTLYHCRDLLAGDTLILHADVLVTPRALAACIASDADFALLTDTALSIPGTMRVKREGLAIADLGHHIAVADGHGTFIGVARLSPCGARDLATELEAVVDSGGSEPLLHTVPVARLARRGAVVTAVPVGAEPWIEIDTAEDYERACAMPAWK